MPAPETICARRNRLALAMGFLRGGEGRARLGDIDAVFAGVDEYRRNGADAFFASGYPHRDEDYRGAELRLPRVSRNYAKPASERVVDTRPFGEILAGRRP